MVLNIYKFIYIFDGILEESPAEFIVRPRLLLSNFKH
jgi:hypothetical protein